MRVPLIVQLPQAIRRAERISDPVSHTDIASTVLDLCGILETSGCAARPS